MRICQSERSSQPKRKKAVKLKFNDLYNAVMERNKKSRLGKLDEKQYLKTGKWVFPEPDTPTKKLMMKEEARVKLMKKKFNYFYMPYDSSINLKKFMEFSEVSSG